MYLAIGPLNSSNIYYIWRYLTALGLRPRCKKIESPVVLPPSRSHEIRNAWHHWDKGGGGRKEKGLGGKTHTPFGRREISGRSHYYFKVIFLTLQSCPPTYDWKEGGGEEGKNGHRQHWHVSPNAITQLHTTTLSVPTSFHLIICCSCT